MALALQSWHWKIPVIVILLQEVQQLNQTFILHLLLPTPPQCRCESLAEVNTQLRLHMEKADVVNKALREDMEKLTVDWSRARDELMRKESQWRMEQEVGGTGGWDCERRARTLGTTLVSVGRGLLGWKRGCRRSSLIVLTTRAGSFALLGSSA